jgi:hypothetical protein
MLIGERLALDFGGYLRLAAVPVGLGLAATWLILLGLSRRRWNLAAPAPMAANPEPASSSAIWSPTCRR